jgi:hypothetical protein
VPIVLHNTGKYCPAGPKSKNTTGEVPKGFFPLLKYRVTAVIDVIVLFLEGKADHMLISPRPIKLEVLPRISLLRTDGTKKDAEELAEETHKVIHNSLGNIL